MDFRKKSKMWCHFVTKLKELNTWEAKCRYCSNVLSFKGGNSSNLVRHLKTQHPTIPVSRDTSTLVAIPKQQPPAPEVPVPSASPQIVKTEVAEIFPKSNTSYSHSLIPSFTSTSESDNDSGPLIKKPYISHTPASTFDEFFKPVSIYESQIIDTQLVQMICKGFQPCSLVEDKEFVNFVHILNPGYKLPSRKAISDSLIPTMFNNLKGQVREKLNTAVVVCLTTDGWTTINNSHLALSVHYLGSKSSESGLELCSFLLSCGQFAEKDTAQNISQWLLKTVKEWGIENKISAIVTDNAANVVSAIRLCNWRHIPCLAHSLNLIVQKGLLDIQPVVIKVKSLVQYFKQSSHAMAKLEEIQNEMGNPLLKLKQNIETRWNTTFDMLDRFFKNKNSILVTLSVLDLNDKFAFLDSEWLIIEQALPILKIFDMLTKDISADKSITLSKVPILIRVMIKKLNASTATCAEIEKMKITLRAEIHVRFGDIESNSLVAQTTLLDPRFKKQGFESEEGCKEACKRLKDELKIMGNISTTPLSHPDDEIPSPSDDFLWDEFDNSVKKLTGEHNLTIASMVEVDAYLTEPLLNRKQGDPLQWWNERKAIYPQLYNLALRRLCLPATSAPCETIFSKAGYIFNEKRSRLKADELSMILFINSNLE